MTGFSAWCAGGVCSRLFDEDACCSVGGEQYAMARALVRTTTTRAPLDALFKESRIARSVTCSILVRALYSDRSYCDHSSTRPSGQRTRTRGTTVDAPRPTSTRESFAEA